MFCEVRGCSVSDFLFFEKGEDRSGFVVRRFRGGMSFWSAYVS